MDECQLRRAIQIILEDLGGLKTKGFRGWGTSQPTYVRSTKRSLGDVEAEDAGDVDDQGPVKVSRAFFAAEEIADPATA